MKRRMQIEDLFSMQFLQSGEFSPNGDAVVYSCSYVEDDNEYSAIYLYEIGSDTNRRITFDASKNANPRFSPDGSQIAFTSDRSGKQQIYLLITGGGEAQRLTDFNQGVGGDLAWSPDGSAICFAAGPDFGDKDTPDLTKEPYRVDRWVYRFDAIGYLDQKVQDLYLLDVNDESTVRLTNDRMNNIAPRWSPDGTRILFLASMAPDSHRASHPQIKTIDRAGNQEIVVGESYVIQAAEWSPVNNKIVFVGRPAEGVPIGTKDDLYVIDTNSGEIDNRTAGITVGVGGSLSLRIPIMGLRSIRIPMTADGVNAYIRVQKGGNVAVYEVSLHGDESHKSIIDGRRACYPMDVCGDALLYSVTDINTPPNLFIAALSGESEKQITSINKELLSQITLPQTEYLTFTSVDGAEVEGWYMKPSSGKAPYPTILYIHGGPHAAYGRGFSFDFHMLAGQGYGVLFLNHRASTGYGDEFSTAIRGDWGNLDYNDLMSGVDCAVEKGLADNDLLGVCGTSGGGNLTCWIIGHTDRFKAAVPQNPVTSWRSFYGVSDIGVWFAVEQLGGHPHEIPEVYDSCSPITYAHRCTTPTLMVQSEHDWRCPAEQSEQFYTVLNANGCTVEMLRQPGGFHGASIYGAINLRREHLIAMLEWFDRYVKKVSKPTSNKTRQ